MTYRTWLTAAVGLGADVVTMWLVVAGPLPGLKAAGAILFACTSTGTALMCWIDTGENTAQAGMVLLTSLAVFSLSAAVMIWVASWHPTTAFAVLAVASALSCGARLVTAWPA